MDLTDGRKARSVCHSTLSEINKIKKSKSKIVYCLSKDEQKAHRQYLRVKVTPVSAILLPQDFLPTRHTSEPLAKIDPYRIIHFLYEANKLYKMQKLSSRPCLLQNQKILFVLNRYTKTYKSIKSQKYQL